MSPNPYQCLDTEDQGLNRPQTPPNKEIKSPKIIQKKKKTQKIQIQSKISATQYLYRARDAIQAAIEEEKKTLGEEYIEDNDIWLLNQEIESIILARPAEIEIDQDQDQVLQQPVFIDTKIPTRIELQSQIDNLDAKIDKILDSVSKSSNIEANRPIKRPIQELENAPTQTQENRPILKPNPRLNRPKTFAEALQEPIPLQQQQQQQKQGPTISKTATYRDRRLILQGTAQNYPKIDSKGLRDQLNKAFKEKCQIVTPVIDTVTKSQIGSDIVLSTTEKFNADFLKKNEAIWKPLLNFSRAIRDTTWHKIVLHGVPTEIFNTEDGMALLEEEIKVYNGLSPISRPKWLSSSENRAKNKYGSAIVSFETRTEVDRALRNRLQIAGISVKTAEYISVKPNTQCTKCLKYRHSEITCYKAQKCALCAGNHAKQDHFCALCYVKGQKCDHTKLKCSNCQEKHEATDRSCIIYKDLTKKFIKPRFETFSHVEVPSRGKNE